MAQGLAYSWRVPLIGISSLDGFFSSVSCLNYAAILDARIGGVYLQKGRIEKGVIDKGDPQIVSLEDAGRVLEETTHLVTPYAKSLEVKLKQVHPHNQWIWEETPPIAQLLLKSVEQHYIQGDIINPPDHLKLLYLRQTEAERDKESRQEKM